MSRKFAVPAQFQHQTTPATPSANNTDVYAKSDAEVYRKTPSGNEDKLATQSLAAALAIALG